MTSKTSSILVAVILSITVFSTYCYTSKPSFQSSSRQSTMMKANQQSDDVPSSSSPSSGHSVGFVGFGTIASSIAKGLLLQEDVPIAKVSVSKRSEAKSTELKSLYPELVTIFDDNQSILDESDIVFICVLPKDLEEVMSKLKFNSKRHTIVSLVSTSVLAELATFSGLPLSQIYKMICLPSVSRCEGTCLLVPRASSKEFLSIFDSLGGTVECANEKIMNRAMIPCNLMGPLYGIMKNTREWLVKQGMPAEDASYLVARQYMGMVQDALRDCENPSRFDDLIAEQTPGGFNEQALRNLGKLGLFNMYDQAMDALLDRLEGRSDGSINP